MKKRLCAILLAAAAALLTSCSSGASSAPLDLTGHWSQQSSNDWYHIATITEDKIKIWWYLPAEDKTNLYWSGSFTPPTDGRDTYTWQSENDYTAEHLDLLFKYRRTSREPVKEFVYKNGQIQYKVTSGHLVMAFALERSDDSSFPVTEDEP